MSIVTLEGIIEQGKVRLPANVHLPEKTKVYVIVPSVQEEPVGHIFSPRLAHPDQVVDFNMEVAEDSPNAKL